MTTKTDDDLLSGMGALETRVANLESGLKENTEATKRIEANTTDLVEFARAASWILKAAKPLSYVAAIGASVAAVWASLKSGIGPK